MAEYIEREDALMNMMHKFHCYAEEGCNHPMYEHALDAIQEIYAEDVAPVVHGRWETVIDHDELWGDMEYYKCSVCGKMELRDAQTPFCPNCGADMRGE